MDLQSIGGIVRLVKDEVGKTIVGQDGLVELLLTSLLAGGHVLLEGVPGTSKTFLAQSFATSLELRFGRIQFTPDMMPGDILGTNLFDFQTSAFTLTPGPIFTDILLADEINRTPPKTQAALLQAMNERTVTIDRKTYALGEEFMVVATQNPIEQQGTYPLPEAQLDRFLFKLIVAYPTAEEEREVVRRHGRYSAMPRVADYGVRPVVAAGQLAAARAFVVQIQLSEELVDYIVQIVRDTREHPAIETGASTRAASMLSAASRAFAAVEGRDFVVPDDVKQLAVPLLRHRVVMTAAAEIEGVGADEALRAIVDRVPVPR